MSEEIKETSVARLDDFQTADEVLSTASILVRSGALPSQIKNAEQATMMIMQGRELGLGAVTSLNNIFIINGKTTLSVHAINGLLRRGGVASKTLEDFAEYEYETKDKDGKTVTKKDRRTTIRFYRKYPDIGVIEEDVTYSWREAMAAGLNTKQTWKSYPKVLLWNRCFVFGARRVAADLLSGLYETTELIDATTPEEVSYTINDDGEAIVNQ